MRGNQLHPPRSTKINIPAASAPRTAKLYHFPSPSVNGAIGTGEGFGRRQQGAPDPLVPVGITPTPQEGSTDTPPEGNTDNPLVGIPTHPYIKQLSAVLLTTLRRTLMQVGRRVVSSKAESFAI